MKFNIKKDLKTLDTGYTERIKPRQEYFLAFVEGNLDKINELAEIYWVKEKSKEIVFTRWAAIGNHIHVIRWLYDNHDINKDEALKVATQLNHFEILKYILDKYTEIRYYDLYELFELARVNKHKNLYSLFISAGLNLIPYRGVFSVEDLYLFTRYSSIGHIILPKKKQKLLLQYEKEISETINRVIQIKNITDIINEYY